MNSRVAHINILDYDTYIYIYPYLHISTYIEYIYIEYIYIFYTSTYGISKDLMFFFRLKKFCALTCRKQVDLSGPPKKIQRSPTKDFSARGPLGGFWLGGHGRKFHVNHRKTIGKSWENGDLIVINTWLPSGNLLHSYWKWPIEIVDLPTENGDFPQLC